MQSAKDVAKWFLAYNEYQRNEADADSISNLKLQKLLYYAQGASMAVNHTRLFFEPIEAWQHGPVVPDVYHEYKEYAGNGIAPPTNFPLSSFADEDTRALLEEVYNTFGRYSAWGLRELTHKEKPWIDTRQDEEIPVDMIGQYFSDHYITHE